LAAISRRHDLEAFVAEVQTQQPYDVLLIVSDKDLRAHWSASSRGEWLRLGSMSVVRRSVGGRAVRGRSQPLPPLFLTTGRRPTPRPDDRREAWAARNSSVNNL